MWDIMVYAFSMFLTGALLFLMVYSIITISDLECDYLNAQECCSRLNFWVKPKIVAESLLVVGFLSDFNWSLALVNIPPLAWLIREYMMIPRGNMGLYDPTEIHHRGQIRKSMRGFVIFTGWYLLTFFFYLYFMILSVLKGNPLETEDPLHVDKF
ncbi:protein cornichon homolog 4 [Adelges cooleyi]|uniref:protein cornichon homolog 4 n=1 Tax=Adelges cooleyi TaxID=133065 RepID=UPI00217FC3E3|nr:protein cornichon homolog 4 [Adelges cooleyi]XP_050422249.1 protein cornichon homolog 4 [Adelges cooleyi]XP_050422250.1 protein cornichon homolog 4 [Adelges cooleyi]